MVSNTIEVKQLNIERIREAIQKHEKSTKASIAKETSLSIATCNTILNEMLESGEVLKLDQTGSSIGRPADQFAYNKDFQHVLGIRVDNEKGVNTVGYAVANALGEIVEEDVFHPDEINYSTLKRLISKVIEKDGNVKAVGLGIPGVAQNGVIEYCDIKALQHVEFAKRIREKFGLEVLVENDMNFVTYNMYDKLPHKKGDLAVVYFPDSSDGYVGCGFVVNGQILKGWTMFSGEISYAAVGFGVSREQQQAALKDREKFHALAAQVLLTVICTINPAHAVIIGNDIDDNDVDIIEEKCLETISVRHVPELRAEAFDTASYIDGLIRLTLDSLQFHFSV